MITKWRAIWPNRIGRRMGGASPSVDGRGDAHPGPTEATVPDTGVVASQIHLQRLTLVNPSTGVPRVISPEGMHVYEFDWSPDGKKLAYLAAPGPGDDNWYIAELYASTQSGPRRHIRSHHADGEYSLVARWKIIAFIGGLMSDEGSTGGDIYLLPSAGGRSRM